MNTPTPWSHSLGYIKLAGLQVKRDAPVVIALHGYLDNANSMADLHHAFPNYHYIAVDLAGHGLSDHRPEGTHYNQLDYIQDLYALVSELPHPVVLVGHSLGGILCTIYASLFPEQVKAVVSIDAMGPLTQPDHTTLEQIRKSVLSRHIKMLTKPASSVDLEKASIQRANTTDLSAQLCRYILARNVISDESGVQRWSSDPRLRTRSTLRMTETQAEQIMRGIQCPVLFMGATSSFKQLEETKNTRMQWVKNASYVCIEGGHHVHLEKTDHVCHLIEQFMSKL